MQHSDILWIAKAWAGQGLCLRTNKQAGTSM